MWLLIGCSLAFFFIGFFFRKIQAEKTIHSAEEYAKEIIEQARKESEIERKDKILEAKEKIQNIRSSMEKEIKIRRDDIDKLSKRIMQKEDSLDKKIALNEKREEQLFKKENELADKIEALEEVKKEELFKLEKISNLTKEEAQQIVLDKAEDSLSIELSNKIKENERKVREKSEEIAREIVAYAIQKVSADEVSETTVSVVNLPNEEMKGRIIGREGRNIRTIEQLTGVDLIVDDTPEAVVLSSFDPLRREVARIALTKLIQDGRIHPTRIEEMVDKAKKELDKKIVEYGENAMLETKVYNLHPGLVKLLGRLHYRTSFGQNVLSHSIEICHLCGIIADELGVNSKIAKRAGLLHDIGKAMDHEVEGTHVEIGMNILRKYNESKEVIHAISTHHGDYEPQSIEAIIVTAADIISAARPGARRETLENYIQRLTNLEEIATTFDGVEKAFAIQAGREIRIIVEPTKISDAALPKLAHDVASKIEEEMAYPGEIKVSILRETRTTAYAR